MDLSTYLQATVVVAIAGAYFGGGLVKGAIGIGLPLVATPVVSMVLSVPQAISLTLVPVLVSNLWQAWFGGFIRNALRRFWPLLLALVASTFVTARFLAAVATSMLDLILAVGLYLTIALLSFEIRLALRPRHEAVVSGFVGVVAGALGGLTSLAGLPVIFYFLVLQLPKDEFVGSIAVVYLFSAAALGVALARYNVLGVSEIAVSTAAVLPMLAGLAVGQWLRTLVDQRLFRRLVLLALALIATGLMQRALRGLWA